MSWNCEESNIDAIVKPEHAAVALEIGVSARKVTLSQQPFLRPGATRLDMPYMWAIEDAIDLVYQRIGEYVSKQVNSFMKSVDNSNRFGKADVDESIHKAIDAIAPYARDEQKADLFARIKQDWDRYPNGVQRRINLIRVFREWKYACARPAKKVVPNE